MPYEMIVAVSLRLLAGIVVGLAVFFALGMLRRTFGQRGSGMLQALLGRARAGLRLFLPLLGVFIALHAGFEGEVWVERLQLGVAVLLILSGGYVLIRFCYGVAEVIESRLGLHEADNLDARRVFTQLRMLRRVLVSLIGLATFVFVLLLFPGAREIGTGLLASAGVAGLIIGFAAQRALGNLLAGFQIAFTQPIRLDDVVVVEGEWGRIEEITLTYVVVRIWDERRLILPISYFLEKPFTNWTRESSEILGTVFLYTDYSVPVDALRAELDRIVDASSHWDGRVKGLVVTDSKPTTLELRALISAKDGGAAWDLRCEVREGLVRFLQREYPESLPRFRTELSPLPG